MPTSLLYQVNLCENCAAVKLPFFYLTILFSPNQCKKTQIPGKLNKSFKQKHSSKNLNKALSAPKELLKNRKKFLQLNKESFRFSVFFLYPLSISHSIIKSKIKTLGISNDCKTQPCIKSISLSPWLSTYITDLKLLSLTQKEKKRVFSLKTYTDTVPTPAHPHLATKQTSPIPQYKKKMTKQKGSYKICFCS